MAKYSNSAAHLKVDDNLSDDWEYLGDKMVAARLTVVLVFPWEAAADWRGFLAAEIAASAPTGDQPSHCAEEEKTIFILFDSGQFTVSSVAGVNICVFCPHSRLIYV